MARSIGRNYANLKKEEKLEIVKSMLKETKASVRQVARISGWECGVLYRLKKKGDGGRRTGPLSQNVRIG